MSDSDWGSSDDEDVASLQPKLQKTPEQTDTTPPASGASSDASDASDDGGEDTGSACVVEDAAPPAKQVFLGLPVTAVHVARKQQTPAGLVLLYDWSPELWTLYAYFAADQTKPVIFNPLTEGKHAFFTDNDKLDLKRLKKQLEKDKKEKEKAKKKGKKEKKTKEGDRVNDRLRFPCDTQVVSQDKKKKSTTPTPTHTHTHTRVSLTSVGQQEPIRWELAFQSTQHLSKFLCVLALAAYTTRLRERLSAAEEEDKAFFLGDVLMGQAKKPLKANYTASVRVAHWHVPLSSRNTDTWKPCSAEFSSFDPAVGDFTSLTSETTHTHTLEGVRVAKQSAVGGGTAPVSIGACLSGGRVDGVRLLVVGSTSAVAKELRIAPPVSSPSSSSSSSSCVVVLLQATNSAKPDKDAPDDSVADASGDVDDAKVSVDAAQPKVTHSSSSSTAAAAAGVDSHTHTDASIAPTEAAAPTTVTTEPTPDDGLGESPLDRAAVRAGLEGLQEALLSTQLSIMKASMKSMFDACVSEDSALTHPLQPLMSRAVKQYKTANSDEDHSGTVVSVLEACRAAHTAIVDSAGGIKGGDMDSSEKQEVETLADAIADVKCQLKQKQKDTAAWQESVAHSAKETSAVAKHLSKAKKKLKEAGDRQLELVMQQMDIEGKIDAVKGPKKKKGRTADHSMVLNQLNEGLSSEIQAKNETEMELEDLICRGRRGKHKNDKQNGLIWLADKLYASCPNCEKEFSFMGAKRSHCRCCGGVCCRGCMKEDTLEELGYRTRKPVSVCVRCYVHRGAVLHGRAAEDGGSDRKSGSFSPSRSPRDTHTHASASLLVADDTPFDLEDEQGAPEGGDAVDELTAARRQARKERGSKQKRESVVFESSANANVDDDLSDISDFDF